MALTPLTGAAIRDLPYYLQEWLRQIQKLVGGSVGAIPWVQVDKTGSNLTDIVSRAHNNLQSIQGGAAGDYYHLTNVNYTDLTDGGDSTLHYHAADRNSANFTGTNWTDLTDAGDSTLHFHAADRARANHTGTQLTSTISDITLTTYTPTLTNTTNLGASTAYVAQYMRIGAIVTVSGRVDVDPTAAGSCVLTMTLPVASNFANDFECVGTAACPTIAGQSAAIRANATNDKAEMVWIAVDITNQPMYYQYTYRII